MVTAGGLEISTSGRQTPEAGYWRTSETCHPVRRGVKPSRGEQTETLALGFSHQPKSDVVVQYRQVVKAAAEIALQANGVDVFVVIAEGEVIEDV